MIPRNLQQLYDAIQDQMTELLDNTSPGSAHQTALTQALERIVHAQVQNHFPELNSQERRQCEARLKLETTGLGPLAPLLGDETITEIMVNGPSQIYVERLGNLERCDSMFISETSLRNILLRIVSPLGRRIDEASPTVDARLPDGSRVHAIIPPLALNGTTLTIRKFSKSFLSAQALIEGGAITSQALNFLSWIIKSKQNMVIAGGTGTGKTTLLNLASSFIPKNERIITIEDSAELALLQEHVIRLETRSANVEGQGDVHIRDLVRNALRMRPDRIVVGECRGGEALDMLQAMNTGHEGSMTTVHANSCRDALLRIETMTLMSGIELPLKAIRQQIASAVHVLVFLKRLSNGQRQVDRISELHGMESGNFLLQDLFERRVPGGPLAFLGRWPRGSELWPESVRASLQEQA